MSKATQGVKEQNCREHETCQDRKKNSQLYLCSLSAEAPIWMKLITWAPDITQQKATPPRAAGQQIAKVGKRDNSFQAAVPQNTTLFI